MRFWDSSALVPLLVSEASTPAVARELEDDADVIAWWVTEIECASALARLEREGALDAGARSESLLRLDKLVGRLA